MARQRTAQLTRSEHTEWRFYPPTVADLRSAGGRACYWVRGWHFDNPVLAEVTIAHQEVDDTVYVLVLSIDGVELNEPARSPRFTNLELLTDWPPLEWAGPITHGRRRTRSRSQPLQRITCQGGC